MLSLSGILREESLGGEKQEYKWELLIRKIFQKGYLAATRNSLVVSRSGSESIVLRRNSNTPLGPSLKVPLPSGD